ncbi:MAG: 23S rRNA (guanosine(2251)-2'-O)-methyltransferase RlmB [Gammaproteobacteria bacterium CG11_big_fil_rev_8_21_14_0_20_46_22]|nr:MAG: 23S rRNA (guanosine(2251)-2'-O)-methyltransferase RlmB [Gammaproteobacteria bacterium CG12_big_fil_rev_8_21_14_0_65_46_12]PIR12098.1 MAG: 23S rRNA (guanosine(2251)-2'-O)-methyltransferase RlmB [Gammaproteobacteria bacterium CG11_big_fil_rev_8_21_14_0_20_46_22]
MDQVFGLHAVESLLRFRSQHIRQLYSLSNRHDKRMQHVLDLAKQAGVHSLSVPRTELDRLAGSSKHQGILAQGDFQLALNENDLFEALKPLDHPPFLLVLDGVEDPRNLGACMRVADGAGVDAVIVPKHRGCEATETVRKVAAGAFDSVPLIQVSNLARVIKQLKQDGIWFVGAADEADQTLYDVDYTGSLAIVVGNEGDGMRRLTKEHCDHLVSIPMKGYVSSLNVSVATGVMLYEALRQRGVKS